MEVHYSNRIDLIYLHLLGCVELKLHLQNMCITLLHQILKSRLQVIIFWLLIKNQNTSLTLSNGEGEKEWQNLVPVFQTGKTYMFWKWHLLSYPDISQVRVGNVQLIGTFSCNHLLMNVFVRVSVHGRFRYIFLCLIAYQRVI